jgi:hypothetical protein
LFSQPAEIKTVHNITAVELSGQEKLRYFVENQGFLNYERKLKEYLKECPKKSIFMRPSDRVSCASKRYTLYNGSEKDLFLRESL